MSDAAEPPRADERDVRPGDVVALRKAHPCGSYEWTVTRIGADIGLRCRRCERDVMLPRHEFRLRLRQVLQRVDQ